MTFKNAIKNINIQKRINNLAKKYKNKKIILYGAGKFANYLFENFDFSKLNIIAIADKKFNKEESFFGYKAISPETIYDVDFDLILIINKDYLKFTEIIYNLLVCTDKKNSQIISILEPTKKELFKKAIKKAFTKEKQVKIDNKTIFTFWEPKRSIPPYLQFCLKTWKKFLPEYKIEIVNYSNLYDYIDKNCFDEYLYKNFNLPKQADAIRIALLQKYGGIWLDIDTIITSQKVNNILNQNSKATMINRHLAFISAKKDSIFIKEWLKIARRKIILHKFYKKNPYLFELLLGTNKSARYIYWDYLGNSIISSIFDNKNLSQNEFLSLDSHEYFTFPEYVYFNNSDSAEEKYIKFYFSNNDYTDFVLENEQGLIMLHNSWTPYKYKQMSEEEFLNSNTTMSNLLKKILEI